MMAGNQSDSRDRPALRTALAREARGDRPAFSERFHERLLERLPAGDGSPTPQLAGAPRGRGAVASLLASAAAVAALGLGVVRSGRDEPPAVGPRQAAVETAAGEPRSVTSPAAVTPAGEAVGIDRLPLFDEIQDGVQRGVTTLAASLLEVPEWTALADFDAAGLLEAATP